MTLAPPDAQQDWSAGMFRGAPHVMPRNSAWRLENMLLDDLASPYKRGGTVAKSDTFGNGLRFVWDGELVGGHRTLFSDQTQLAVLDSDDQTPIALGAGGMATPLRPTVLDGILYVGNYAYAGSVSPTTYSTGTLAVTAGSPAVVGTGTAWASNFEQGSLLIIGGRIVAVDSVTDDTHLTLALDWPGATASGLAYSGGPVAQLPAAYHPGAVHAAVGNRLLAGIGRRVYESAGGDATSWDVTEYHELPEGAEVLGIAGLGDLAHVFTTQGVYVITNTYFDLTDDFGGAQQQLQPIAGQLVLWGDSGIASWRNALVLPTFDGVWLYGEGSPELITVSIGPLYDTYVRAGYRPGGAFVFKSHYLLPILDLLGHVAAVRVCRLDRPGRVRGLGTVYPWTTLAGAGANVSAFTGRFGSGEPELLAAERGLGSKVLVYPPFTPDGEPLDHDGSTVQWDFVLRDWPTSPALNENLVKKFRLRYELVGDDAEIEAVYGTEARPTGGGVALSVWDDADWDTSSWTEDELSPLPDHVLEETAPPSDGDTPKSWRLNKRVRYLRLRFRGRTPSSRAVIRTVEVFVRPSGRM